MSTLMKTLILLLIALLPYICGASNILFLSPFPVKSHWLWLNHFVRHLLDRGHHLTTLTNFPTKEPHRNLTEIIIDPMFDIPAVIPKENLFKMRFGNDFENVHLFWNVGLWTTEHALNDPKVKALIADKRHKYDLIILEQFFHDSFLMFAHKFKCPIVTISTLNYADHMDHAMGTLTPWSIIPHTLLTLSDHMTFKERAYNSLISLYDNFFRIWSFLPKMQNLAEQHFTGHVEGPLPHVRDLEKNVSFMLVNSHRALNAPRPKMPGLVDVAGAHIKPAKPLPADLQKFFDKSSQGVIYFSLGSYVESRDMPQAKIAQILKAFGKLKQNVLWKFENENITNLPPNVMIRKWMPQNDILAQPNVKVFMTHGGIFGTQEGIYWAKPLLCIPLYGDQHRNTIKAVRAGYARALNFAEMTDKDIVDNLKLLLGDPSYKRMAKEMSEQFRNNPLPPMDMATFWIEYTIKHKGAGNLKSFGVHMPWYKYLLLDVLGCCLLVVIISLWLVFKLIKVIFTLMQKTKKADKVKKTK